MRSALKPSLVEWKPAKMAALAFVVWVLETFLSGMETQPRRVRPGGMYSLETFLSGMETT